MGYKFIKDKTSYVLSKWKRFYCDYLSDIQKLPTSKKMGAKQADDTVSDDPCAPGSECFCFEDSSIWLLGVETDTWVKVGYKYDMSSGGSGNTGGNGSGSTPSITSYNQLSDIPLKNIASTTSTPLVLSILESGIYKIVGNFSIIPNSKKLSTKKSGDIFIVSDGKIMEMASDGITLFDIQTNTYTTNTYTNTDDISDEILKQLNSENFNMQIEDIIDEKLSYATNTDIDNLFK